MSAAQDSFLVVEHLRRYGLIAYPVRTLWVRTLHPFMVIAALMVHGLVGMLFADPALEAVAVHSGVRQPAHVDARCGIDPIRARQDFAAVPLAVDLVGCPEVHVDHGADLQAGAWGRGSHLGVEGFTRFAFKGDRADGAAFLGEYVRHQPIVAGERESQETP